MRAKNKITTEKIEQLISNLGSVIRYYDNTEKLLDGMLVDVFYNDIIAKSGRIERLLKPAGKDINKTVVGARFSDAADGLENHIITYYLKRETIEKTIKELQEIKRFLDDKFAGGATAKEFNETKSKLNYSGYALEEKEICNLIVDCSVVEKIARPDVRTEVRDENFLVTFYKTEQSVSEILEKIKVDRTYMYSFYGEDTISVTKDLYAYIAEKIPYMISMVSADLSKISYQEIEPETEKETIIIPNPTIEPTIGVIDTLFDEQVYFTKWVDNRDCLDIYERGQVREEHRIHGTQVSSLIVDGPRLNPWLDDGCGRFRVRHFGVCLNRISVSRLVRKIIDIVNDNPDIHVWNLSLGTDEEVSKNFISFDAAVLDELQAKKNVIFVVAGTNDSRSEKKGTLRIGSPADSLNAVVVNSVRRDGRPASYTRKGEVLSFFQKPDVSYYGGDYDEKMNTYTPNGEWQDCGTSLAAPWISRKLAFLIDVMGMPREVAKALLIDSAAGWEYKIDTYKHQTLTGYGIVPIDIKNVMASENSEIRFYLYGTSKSYRTTNYMIPIPKDEDGKYSYIARAILCYFPNCTRAQGVDYTDRELSLKFGRVKEDGSIDDINKNVQEDAAYIDERKSRKDYRKWENTKFISMVFHKNKALKSYGDRQWGFSVTSKERDARPKRNEMNFGAVITLREIQNRNRISDFIKLCEMRGWIVNEIDVENRLNVYVKGQEEIEFR